MTRLALELGYPMHTRTMAERLASLLASPVHHVAVVAGGEGLLGWVQVEQRMSLEGGEQAELMGLVVDAAARGSGLGRALVAHAESWAASRGIAAMTVRSNTARDAAHPFYRAMGYSRDKTQQVYRKLLHQ